MMKNWEDMVEYYKNNPTARYNILKNAGLLKKEPMKDRNDFPKTEEYNPDEIIVEDIEMFHAEVMEQGKSLWIGITRKNGQIDHLNICVKGNKLSTLWSPNTGNMNPDA
jgi:hypothetical protein